MEIKIQLDKNIIEHVIGTLVCEQDSDDAAGEIISYDKISGVAICKLYDNFVNVKTNIGTSGTSNIYNNLDNFQNLQ
jgi:hypothetical protein